MSSNRFNGFSNTTMLKTVKTVPLFPH